MRFFHLSDLHIGKQLHHYNLREDQEYILGEVISYVKKLHPDAVVIAGDIYDKSVPSGEAVTVFDDFLTRLSETEPAVPILIISGNHDSARRLDYASRLLGSHHIYIAGKVPETEDEHLRKITLQDEYGNVHFWLLPFLKPAHVRRYFPEEEIGTYTEALGKAVEALEIHKEQRNVLVTHQFVTGASRSDSEEISVGGSDNVDASVFDDFDYVALGHIHGPQNIGSPRIRYCGTPLKYSFSEVGQQKSVTVAELKEKGTLEVTARPLTPLRDLREIRGSYLEVTAKSFYEGRNREDYLHITLTDEEDVPDGAAKLRVIYPNLMRLDYDNARTRSRNLPEGAEEPAAKPPLELFEEFYERQNNQPMTEEQIRFSRELMETIWEDKI